MAEEISHSIELLDGFTDKDGVTHKSVTFGRRMTVGELKKLDNDPQARVTTQYTLLIVRAAITEFGAFSLIDKKGNRRAVPLPFLLALDSLDREDLIAAHDEFLYLSRGDRSAAEVLDDANVALAFGFEIGGTSFDLVTFGRRLNGHDAVEADKLGLTGVGRICFEINKQIEKIASSETGEELTGALALEAFDALDAEDLSYLRLGAERFRQSFRHRRTETAGKRDGKADHDSHEGNRANRKRSSELVN